MWITTLILILWTAGVVLAVFDGDTLLRATTPAATLVFGWAFTERATS